MTISIEQSIRSFLSETVVKQISLKHSMAEKFVELVVEAINSGSIKISDLAQYSSGALASNIKTIERLYKNLHISTTDIGLLITSLLSLHGRGPFTFIMDRTEWKYGKTHINIFVVAVLLKNTVIPVVIDVSNKEGTSNFEERKRMVNQLINLVGKQGIKAILGDREFLGKEWFQYLHEKRIPFAFRLRENLYAVVTEGRIKLATMFAEVTTDKAKSRYATIGQVKVRLSATRSESGELVIVASSKVKGDVFKKYKTRWFIELFFRSIKTMGFNIEDTHITAPDRLRVLMAVIAVATCVVTRVGLFKDRLAPVRRKKHGRKAYSIFTYGLIFIRRIFREGSKAFTQELRGYIQRVKVPIPTIVKIFLSFIFEDFFVRY